MTNVNLIHFRFLVHYIFIYNLLPVPLLENEWSFTSIFSAVLGG
jgi:hypothetical protein